MRQIWHSKTYLFLELGLVPEILMKNQEVGPTGVNDYFLHLMLCHQCRLVLLMPLFHESEEKESTFTIRKKQSHFHRHFLNKLLCISLNATLRGGSRTTATSKMERCVIIVRLPAVNYYHKALHLGCCSSPRSASDSATIFKCNI